MKQRFGMIGYTHKFDRLYRYHVERGEPFKRIKLSQDIELSIQLQDIDTLVILAKNVCFSERDLNHLRNFVEHGGHITWLSRKGGDLYNNANHSLFNHHIQDRNDVLVQHHHPAHQPDVRITLNRGNLQYREQVIFDGGCTYTVDSDWLREHDGFAITPSHLQALSGVNDISGTRRFHHSSTQFYWRQKDKPGAVLVFYKKGLGSVLYWGARWTFSNSLLGKRGHLKLWDCLIGLHWEPFWNEELTKRMDRAQRHRLLHAYPMTAGLRAYTEHPRQLMNLTKRKRNAIGIIPHTFCNTGKPGCGFCTFPHENYSKSGVSTSMMAVRKELQIRKETARGFVEAPVSSVYFGGGTANLSRIDEWKGLLDELKDLKISKETEFTLEGAPVYFWTQRKLLEELCSQFPTSKKRISIGVQSFNPSLIAKMGRTLMNNKLDQALQFAQTCGVETSIDLLANLPLQNQQDMLDDINRAVDRNIPHICVYNLVSYSGLGTEWSEDPSIQALLPTRTQRMENIQAIHEHLASLGYDAITLTDFQLRTSGESGRYRYEEDIRQPEYVNWWGIGPGGISVLWDRYNTTKLVNPQLSTDYIEKLSLDSGVTTWDKAYRYKPLERKIYWLTRQIKGLSIDPIQYQRLFGTHLETEFGKFWKLFRSEGLLNDHYTLTHRGRYFADAMTGILADSAHPLRLYKRHGYSMLHKGFTDINDSRRNFMG